LHSMDMVAPGGQLHLQTEAPGIYKVTRGLMEEQGWVILDFTEGGEPTVRTFVPSSISAFGESDIFGRENAGNYDHGLIGVKPSPSARVPDAQSGFGVDPTGHAVTGGVYGAMTVLHGVQTDNPYLIAGGLSQTVSGGLSLAGEAAGSQFLRTAGSRAGWLGFAITASVVAGDVYNDFTSGDGLEQINGLLKIAGMVHPLGFVGQQGYDWVVHQGPQVMGQWNHGIHNVFGVPYY